MKKNNLSQHEKNIISVLRSLVANQKIEIKDTEGRQYRSEAKTEGENLSISYLYYSDNNGKEKLFLKIIYDHDSGTEQEFWQEDD